MEQTKSLTIIAILVVFSCYIHTTTSAKCNRNVTGDTQNFAYCCCRQVNFTVTLSGTNTTLNLNASTVAPTTVAVITNSSGNTTTNVTTQAPTTSIPTTSTLLLSTTSDPSASVKCFYNLVSGTVYNECHCWNVRKQEEIYNTTSGNITNSYKCFNVTKLLYIGGLFDTDSKNHMPVLPAAIMAVNDINNRSDILPLYKIVLLSNISTKNLLNFGSKILLDYLYKGPPKIALLGPNSNDIAKTTAAIAGLPRFRILQISYGTDAIDLSEQRDVFPYFFRTKLNPELLYNQARVELLKLFKWNRVGLLYNTDPYYIQLNQLLVQLLKSAGISIIAEASFGADPTGAIKSLKVQGAHVILGTYSQIYTNEVFCQAYCNDMWGPHYVWLLLGTVSFRATAPCTLEQITCAARAQFFFYRRVEKTTAVNTGIYQTPDQFLNRFRSIAGNNTRSETQAKYTYDAMWAIADVLHRTEKSLLPSRSLLDYNYGNHSITDEIYRQTLRTSFYGASDKVEFGKDGNRRMLIDVYQKNIAGGGWSYKGNYDNARFPKLAVGGLIWTGGEPFRETLTELTWRYITFGLYVFYCILAGLGILFALFCLIVIIWKRKTRKIYYSCVPINVIIIIGCLLVYISVFLFGVDGSISSIIEVDRICRARMWVFCLGAALIAGGLIAKLYVAYNVLAKRILWKKRRRLIMMLIIVAVIFFITLLILLCWHFINPHGRTVKLIKEQVKYLCNINILPQSPFLIKLTAIEQCTCENSLIWYPLIIVWALLLLAAGCFLAYQSRSVYISALNDTQRCGTCMYIIVVGCIIGVIIALLTRLYPDIFFGLVGIIILIVVTAILIILFLNKVLQAFSCSSTCFSRCRDNNNGGGSHRIGESNEKLACCRKCCKGRCPRCLACCLCLCLPFLACLSKLFGCCGKCCCGSGDSGSSSSGKSGKEKFIIDGVGNDKDAELARMKRELDMKEKYIRRLRRQSIPYTFPIATQTDSGNGKDRNPSNIKIFSQTPDYSNVKSKVDSGLDGKSPDDGELEADRLKRVLAEKDKEIDALKKKDDKKKEEAFELKSVDDNHKSVSPSRVQINVLDHDDDLEAEKLIQEIDGTNTDRLDDPNRQGYHGARRASNIKIFSQKPDWSHVRSKLKATGAISKNFGKGADPTETVIVNAPPNAKFKRISSLSNLPLKNVVTPVEDSKESLKPNPDVRRGSAPILLVPTPVTQIASMDPLPEKNNENRKSPIRKISSESNKSKNDSPRSDAGVRVVNGPSDLKARSKSDENSSSPSTDYSDGGKSNKKSLDAPPQNLSPRRGSNVKIFNDPKDYRHIKSKIGGASPNLRADHDGKRGSVQIVNKPLDLSHVKSKLY